MKTLSHILSICLCFAPLFGAGASGVVASTSGSNLTAFNPSNSYNNQWATLSNGRSDADAPTAKVDFGNCNALVSRCAQPKCANGGCADKDIAASIVKGCIQSNKICEQYGNDLIEYMSAQLVANSNVKIRQQEAQLAAQAAAASQQQMAQMQQQMYEMQNMIEEQNENTARQVEAALAQQRQENQQAAEKIASAARDATMTTEAGISAYEQDAINRGIANEVLERNKVLGRIETEIQGAETAMAEVKKVMNDTFEYAGCDAKGSNCSGPTRVRRFREKALLFTEPYDTVVEKIENALDDAQMVGVDVNDIYMFLGDSCRRWARYLCPQNAASNGGTVTNGNIVYNDGVPYVCEETTFDTKKCNKCTTLEILENKAEIYEGWLDSDVDTSSGNATVVACADTMIDDSKLLKGRVKAKKGDGNVDIEEFKTWLAYDAPSFNAKSGTSDRCVDDSNKKCEDYCKPTNSSGLKTIALSKTVNNVCVTKPGGTTKAVNGCPYINPNLAICDVHAYNAGKAANPTDSSEKEEIREMVRFKSMIITQEMYKQYEYLSSMLRRLQTHIERAIYSTKYQAAGAKSDGSLSSSTGAITDSVKRADKTIFIDAARNCASIMDFGRFNECLQDNISLITTYADSADKKNACLQLQSTLDEAHTRLTVENNGDKPAWNECNTYIKSDGNVNIGNKCVGDDGKKPKKIKACAYEIASQANAIKRRQDANNNAVRFTTVSQ